MQPTIKSTRTLTDLLLAMAIGFLLLLLNMSINFWQEMERFFRAFSAFPLTDWLVNGLFLWLVILLFLAFRRWRAAALQRAEMEDIISSISPDVLLVVSPAREVEMCNKSVTRMFGYAPADVRGRKTDLLYFDRRVNPDRPREIYEALEKDGFHVGEAKGKRRDGVVFPLEIISAELRGRTGAVLLLRDISERAQAERRRLDLERRIQVQERMESLGVLAGGVAHDFNNLLAIIQGNAELLEEAVPPDTPHRQQVDDIVAASGRAAGLCRQMLAYAGKGKFTVETLDLAEIARHACRGVASALGRQVRLDLQLVDGLPPVEGDRVQLEQVVMNLVVNASEAIGEREGVIVVAAGLREADAAYLAGMAGDVRLTPGRYLWLQVGDTGAGMDGGTVARVFDPFFSTKGLGRGLGLASVQGIARGHGGAVRVESTPGRGSTFTVLLPPCKALA